MLQKETIESMAALLKIKPDVLSQAIASDKEESIELDVKHAFTDAELDGLKERLNKDAQTDWYNKGKMAGEDMLVKNFKKAQNLEGVEASTLDDLWKHKSDEYTAALDKLKTQLSGNNDEKAQKLMTEIEDYKKTVDTLRGDLQGRDAKIEELNAGFESKLSQFKIDNLINDAVSSVNINVPDEIIKRGDADVQKYIQSQRRILNTMYRADRKVDIAEDAPVIFKGEEKLVDKYQKPITLGSDVLQFAKDINLPIEPESKDGRGGKSSKVTASAIKGIKTSADFHSYMEKQGKKMNTPEYDQAYLEWRKENSE